MSNHNTFVSSNYLKLVLTLFLIVIVVIYYRNSNASLSYKYDSECSALAKNFAEGKNKTDYPSKWSLIQSKFSNDDKICVAELYYWPETTTGIFITNQYIYDLTHNKELGWLPDYSESKSSPDVYNQHINTYMKVKDQHFKSN